MPDVGGNKPVRIDLSESGQGCNSHHHILSQLSRFQKLVSDACKCTADNLCVILHSSGLARSIVAEEGGYLPLIELQ